MAIEIRTVPESNLREWAESISFANSEELSDDFWRDVAPLVEPDRTLGAYDGNAVVGGGSVFSFDLTVPGGRTLPSAGVTWIGVMPTHRRQGALRGLMTRMLEDANQRNEPLAMLWASEGSIYQRFGYGLATLSSTIDLERERAVLMSAAPAQGTVRLIDADEARQAFPPIFERSRAQVPGFYSRSRTWWDVDMLSDFKWSRRGFDKKFFALHETDGWADAYAIYRVRHDWTGSVPGSELQIIELMAGDGVAVREMWRYVFGVDLIKRITTRSGAAAEPLLLMLGEPRRLSLQVRDGLWLRIVDVPAALSGRGYAGDDSIVLEVDDGFIPDAGGRWRLTTVAGEGTVEPSSDPADLALETNDLASVYLGGFTFEDIARAGRGKELAPGARARADAMFATTERAWCPQVF